MNQSDFLFFLVLPSAGVRPEELGQGFLDLLPVSLPASDLLAQGRQFLAARLNAPPRYQQLAVARQEHIQFLRRHAHCSCGAHQLLVRFTYQRGNLPNRRLLGRRWCCHALATLWHSCLFFLRENGRR